MSGGVLFLLLIRPPRLPLLLGVYLGTVAIAYFALGVVLMLGLAAVAPDIDPTVRAWVQGGVGIALFAGSWFIPDRDPERTPRPPRTPTIGSMVLLGLGTWLFEFYTAIPYFAAIGVMTSAGLEPGQWLLLLAVYVTIMILPGIVVYIAWLLLQERAQERFERWQSKLADNPRNTLSWVVGIAGVLIFLDALPDQITVGIS